MNLTLSNLSHCAAAKSTQKLAIPPDSCNFTKNSIKAPPCLCGTNPLTWWTMVLNSLKACTSCCYPLLKYLSRKKKAILKKTYRLYQRCKVKQLHVFLELRYSQLITIWLSAHWKQWTNLSKLLMETGLLTKSLWSVSQPWSHFWHEFKFKNRHKNQRIMWCREEISQVSLGLPTTSAWREWQNETPLSRPMALTSTCTSASSSPAPSTESVLERITRQLAESTSKCRLKTLVMWLGSTARINYTPAKLTIHSVCYKSTTRWRCN